MQWSGIDTAALPAVTSTLLFHVTWSTSAHGFPLATLINPPLTSSFVLTAPRQSTFGILLSQFTSLLFMALRICWYSPTRSSGHDQYPKSGISHISLSRETWREKVQMGWCSWDLSGMSVTLKENSIAGSGKGDDVMARLS